MSGDSGFQVPPELRNPFAGWFSDREYEAALEFLSEQPAEPTPLSDIPAALGGTRPADEFSLTRNTERSPLDALLITKQVSYIDVPDELLMDAGVIPDTRPPRPPLPWRWRMRNRVAGWREKLACRAFRVVAGYDAPDYAGDE